MRAVSFALTTSFLFGFARGNSCTYGTFTTEVNDSFLEECYPDGNSIRACTADDQGKLEAAIATELWTQCQCVYYDANTAFNYIGKQDCWRTRDISGNGRCWTSAYKTFYTSGGLGSALKTICTPDELPPTTAEPTTVEPTTVEPTTAEPTTVEPTTVEPTTVEPTTPEPTTAEPVTDPSAEPSIECVDDPDGTLSKFAAQFTCEYALAQIGGCDTEMPKMWKDFIFGGKDQQTVCPKSCHPECASPKATTTENPLICQDDPNDILKDQHNGMTCTDMLYHTNGCDDQYGIVPHAVPGHTALTVCPATCDPQCQ